MNSTPSRVPLVSPAASHHGSGESPRRSEARFRSTFDQAAVGMAHVALDGSWLLVNERLCTMLGYTREELLRKTFQDVTYPPDLEADLAFATRLIAGEIETYSLEKRYVRRDGSIVWGNLTGSLVRDPDTNAPDYCIAVIEDISERKHIEQQLRASEEFLRRIIESSQDCIKVLDLEGRLLSMSAGGQRLLEIEDTRPLIDASWIEMWSPADRDRVRAAVDAAAGGRTGQFEASCPTQTGQARWWDVVITPMLRDGRPERLLAVSRDITVRKQGEERDRTLRRMSAALTEVLDEDEVLRRLSSLLAESFADWAMVDAKDDVGQVRRLAGAQRDARTQAMVDRLCRFPARPPNLTAEVMATGRLVLLAHVTDAMIEAHTDDDEYRRAMLEARPRSVLAVPVRVGEQVRAVLSCARGERRDPFTGADLLFLDETAKRAALALENARLYGEAQRANRQKDEFIATLSHELRTPLNAMLGWASMLRQGVLSPAQRDRALATIERNGRMQAQLLADILDVTRIVSGKVTLSSRLIEMGPALDHVVETMRLGAAEQGLSLDVRIGAPRAVVIGDPERMQQIVWNLVSNAIKFTPPGGRVQLFEDVVDGQVQVVVRDNGVGIAPEFLPHVFERFRQADTSPGRARPGLGLGLAIARHLVELHGGTITAHSRGPGAGAEFTVRLPLAHALPRREDASGGSAPAESLGGLRLLVVDDHDDTREMMQVLLRLQGARVAAAASSEEAEEVYREVGADVALVDISMPGEDGYACLLRLRSAASAIDARLPAIALTAHAHEQARLQALAAGFDAHVAKPTDLDHLVAAIKLALRGTGEEPAPDSAA